jgi:hypothetical protein
MSNMNFIIWDFNERGFVGGIWVMRANYLGYLFNRC